MATERRRVHYAGRVQGVGFRFTTQRLARGFAVTGTVRNLADGRVELVVEGDPEPMAAFLEAIQREMGRKIQSVTSANVPCGDPPFSGFSIVD